MNAMTSYRLASAVAATGAIQSTQTTVMQFNSNGTMTSGLAGNAFFTITNGVTTNKLRPKSVHDGGFTLLEVIVAMFVMTIGLMAAAALAASTMGTTHASKFMSTAGILASEKLEDLNRWDPNDPQICIPTGISSMGSLSQDLQATVTCPAGSSGTVNYYDDVFMGETGATSAAGCPIASSCFTETVSGTGPSGIVYTTTYHAPSGIISSQNSTTAPTLATFHRRWVIESQPALNGTAVGGVRRITVQVTALDATVKPAVNFQMSMVRP